MFGFSFTEIIVVALFAILFIGPKRLPDVIRTIAKVLRDVRRSTNDFKETFENAMSQDTMPENMKAIPPKEVSPESPPCPNPQQT